MKYRSVLVLCELEGRTYKQAAQQLRVPEGTVAGWLARAKAMLAKRLTRQGVAISSGTLAVLLAQNFAWAAVPRSLIVSTINAASLLAAGQSATGVVLPGAVALSKGVLMSMFITKCKTVALALFATLVCTYLAVSAAQTGGQDEKPPTTQAAPPRTDSVVTGQPKTDVISSVTSSNLVQDPITSTLTTWYSVHSLVRYDRLGGQLEQLNETLAEQLSLPKDQGLALHNILLDSAAAKAGLKNHDILLEFAGKKVPNNLTEFYKFIDSLKAGEEFDAVVVRKGKRDTVKGITLPEAGRLRTFYYYYLPQGASSPPAITVPGPPPIIQSDNFAPPDGLNAVPAPPRPQVP